jgi:4-hydroxy-3-methylbut-2-en-1-yl diphosphate reductase
MQIEIDNNSGFCFGVQKAIELAEESLKQGTPVFCLGEIVHNPEEIKRLEALGMKTIQTNDLKNITHANILVRAHGEPPSTFKIIEQNNNTLYEGTCPIVKQIQNRIKKAWEESKSINGQIVVFGKKNHAEVIGLLGQTDNEAILICDEADLNAIDFRRPVTLFSQTTMDNNAYSQIASEIQKRMKEDLGTDNIPFTFYKTICGHVSGRGEKMKLFATNHDVIIFVSGLNSSNGKILYELCLNSNPRTHWVDNEKSIQKEWFNKVKNVGICGATSTPRWLMKQIAEEIKRI